MRLWLAAAFVWLAVVAPVGAAVLYTNAVGLKPGEFARFVAEPQGRGDHLVVVRDGRTGDRFRRTLSGGERREGRFHKLRVRIAFNERIRVRVANGSSVGRRVRVRVLH